MIIIAIITHYIDHHKSWQFFYHILKSYGIRIISHTYKGYYLLPHYLAFTSGTWVFVTLTTVFLLRQDLLNVFQSWSQVAKQFTHYQYLQHKVFALLFWFNMPKYMIGYIYQRLVSSYLMTNTSRSTANVILALKDNINAV